MRTREDRNYRQLIVTANTPQNTFNTFLLYIPFFRLTDWLTSNHNQTDRLSLSFLLSILDVMRKRMMVDLKEKDIE